MPPSQDENTTGQSRKPLSKRLAGLAHRLCPSRKDLPIAVLGTVLGLGSALFPWYIFFNQDQFGPQAMRFSGEVGFGPAESGPQADRIGAPFSLSGIGADNLDLFPTGTVSSEAGRLVSGPEAAKQPFPAARPTFRLVHVANGRAMIEDDTGLFVVQLGSRLPDNSRVAAIERRDGHWVLRTTGNTELTSSD